MDSLAVKVNPSHNHTMCPLHRGASELQCYPLLLGRHSWIAMICTGHGPETHRESMILEGGSTQYQ